MATEYHDLKHPRKISEITDREIAGYGSTDGGTVWTPLKVATDGAVYGVGGLIPEAYDYIDMTYAGKNVTEAVYYTGGVGGDIVATLAFTYSGDLITSIIRT